MTTLPTTAVRLDSLATAAARHDGAYRGKRISWKEFRKLMAEAANDNNKESGDVRPTKTAA